MDKRILAGGLVLLGLLGAGGGWWAWRARHAAPPPVAEAEPAAEPAKAPPPPAGASAPAVRYPVATLPTLPDPAAPADAGAAAPTEDFGARLRELLGARAANALLLGDGLVGRLVVTIDNLGREHATPRLWPFAPTGGRFSTERAGEGERIAASNAARYQPFVRLAEAVDTPAAVALYVRFYPQFQQAYAALGYPRVYFNDRLIDVIDQLLATPVPDGAPAVRLPEARGAAASTPPWTRWEFVDPAYEALPAGQKILLRMGSDNTLRLKAKLAEFRRALAAPGAAR